MGRLVIEELAGAPDLALAWSASRVLPEDLTCDVIVDFSVPEAFARLLERAAVPVVSGTTGVLPDGRPVGVLVDAAAGRLPILHAANFSAGVAVLAKLVREAAAALPDYDVEVVEMHHIGKRDAPSGTALRLVEGLGPVVNGRTGPRVPGEVGVHALRGGDVIGEHTVYLAGPGERLALGHLATRRGVFASGALRAARWLVGRPPGRYRFEDVFAPG
jgi:4-hydroxy-tetrahydrodipicolinate reductase